MSKLKRISTEALCLGILLILLYLVNICLGIVVVNGDSMEPSLHNGSIILIRKIATAPAAGDVVVFHDDSDRRLVKRVIATAHDVVDVEDGRVTVNGEPLDEPYLNAAATPAEDAFPITVEDDSVFVLGDNRENSADSRTFGAVSVDAIEGICILILKK